MQTESEAAWPARHVPETTSREGYTSAEVAERLTEGGALDREHLLARFRGFVRRNYITPTGLYVGDKKKAYLYGLPEVFVAAVLGRLCDAGFNDSAAMLAASNALNNFNVEDFPDGPPPLRADPSTRAWSPAVIVLDAYVTDVRGWMLDLGSFRHPDHGLRSCGRIRNQTLDIATGFHSGDGFALRSTHVVPLDDVLKGIFAVGPKPGEAVH